MLTSLAFSLSKQLEECNGRRLSCRAGHPVRARRGIRQGLRAIDGRVRMSLLTLLAGIAAGGLLIYLIAALLFPEDFS